MTEKNYVELIGTVGTTRLTPLRDGNKASFTLCTSEIYTDKSGMTVYENTWHNVILFSSETIHPDIVSAVDAKMKLHIKGRIKQQRYEGPAGNVCNAYYIIANEIEFISPDEEVCPETH